MNLLNIYLLILTILLGLCVGSFLNVVIYRLPREMSLASPASHCPNCNYKLKWYDNIPVLSFLMLKGKCRSCKQKISKRYIFIEILNALLWVACFLVNTDIVFKNNNNDYVLLASSCISCSALICVFCSDLETMIIPDQLQITILIMGLISMFSNSVNAKDKVIGFLIGGGFFASVYYISLFIKKKECLGFGDVKLMAVSGLLLGTYNTILTIILSSVIGAIILLIVNFSKKEGINKEYPFAVFIVPACIVAMFFGEPIITWYMSLFMI